MTHALNNSATLLPYKVMIVEVAIKKDMAAIEVNAAQLWRQEERKWGTTIPAGGKDCNLNGVYYYRVIYTCL